MPVPAERAYETAFVEPVEGEHYKFEMPVPEGIYDVAVMASHADEENNGYNVAEYELMEYEEPVPLAARRSGID